MAQTIVNKVIEWSSARDILTESTPKQQWEKAMEEMFELHEALILKDMLEVKDAIGDVQVCLINIAAMVGMDYHACLASAYDEIKDRKGRMIKGKFVKEE